MSQPARAVWIEILASSSLYPDGIWSQPARAVWIEMSEEPAELASAVVTACEGCVD